MLFTSTSRYLDDLLNIDNIYFEQMVHRINPAELQLNKANASDTETAFFDLNLSIHNDTVKVLLKDMINGMILILLIFRFLMAMSLGVPLMVYIYQLIRFARASSHVNDFKNRKNILNSQTPYARLCKAIGIKHFPNFIVDKKCNSEGTPHQGISNPEFYGDLVYKLYVTSSFGFEGWILVLIASVPDLCTYFTFRLYAVDCMPSF